MKIKFVSLSLMLLLGFLVLIPRIVLANPIAEPTLKDWFDTESVLILVGCALLETAIINLFLSFKEKIKVRIILYIFVFILNIITISTLAYVLFITRTASYSNEIYFYAALELIVVIVEFWSLYWFFKYFKSKYLLKKNYSTVYILVIVIISNIISFFAEILYSIIR